MGSHFEIVRYEAAHKEQVLRLQQHLWGHNAALNRAYFEWKYEANPYLREPAICLAMHHGAVVGMRGITGARWQMGTSGPMHAAEVFFANTPFKVFPVRRIEDREMPAAPGPVQRRLWDALQKIVTGADPPFVHWLYPVN